MLYIRSSSRAKGFHLCVLSDSCPGFWEMSQSLFVLWWVCMVLFSWRKPRQVLFLLSSLFVTFSTLTYTAFFMLQNAEMFWIVYFFSYFYFTCQVLFSAYFIQLQTQMFFVFWCLFYFLFFLFFIFVLFWGFCLLYHICIFILCNFVLCLIFVFFSAYFIQLQTQMFWCLFYLFCIFCFVCFIFVFLFVGFFLVLFDL